MFSQINWINFNTSNSEIPYNQVNSIELDDNNNVFVGTAFGLGILNIDLSDFSNNIWNTYFENPNPNIGLIGNDIINIQQDLTNSLWVSTTNGISILEYNNSMNQIETWSYLNSDNSILPSNISKTSSLLIFLFK